MMMCLSIFRHLPNNKDLENGGSLDLGKVIMTMASRQLNVLMVVEETPPLIDAA
jgi:hypothetical protein